MQVDRNNGRVNALDDSLHAAAKGKQLAGAVIWPSAKMQTISPSRIASLAVRSERIISRGRNSDEMGGLHRRAKGFTIGLS